MFTGTKFGFLASAIWPTHDYCGGRIARRPPQQTFSFNVSVGQSRPPFRSPSSPIRCRQNSHPACLEIAMRTIILSVVAIAAALCTAPKAQAFDPYAEVQLRQYNAQMNRPWHGGYYAQQYGQPTALVVPPTVRTRQTLSWGVSQNLMYPVEHQFGRSANSPGAAVPGQFRPTPIWPSHTDQFGYYYVRGPWK